MISNSGIFERKPRYSILELSDSRRNSIYQNGFRHFQKLNKKEDSSVSSDQSD